MHFLKFLGLIPVCAPGAVFILSRDRTAAKSAVKKEIKELKRAKSSSEKRGTEATALNF